jgi:DNA-binding winged helix-turn-helix (wHTH) protein
MVYIPTKVAPVSAKTTLENARKWLNIVRFGESGTVIQLQDDCEYRVSEIIENPKILKQYLGPYYRKYLLSYFLIFDRNAESVLKENLLKLIESRKIEDPKKLEGLSNPEIIEFITNKGFELGLFISVKYSDDGKKFYNDLVYLEEILQKAKNLSIIIFSETDISTSEFETLQDKCTLFFDHVIKYPLYSKEDSLQFIEYNNSMWYMNLKPEFRNKILSECGGYLWLISHIQRYFRDNPDSSWKEAIDDELLLDKLEVIWGKLNSKEKNIVITTHANNLTTSDKNSHEYKYLLKINLLWENKGKTILNIPLFRLVIKRETDLNELKFENHKIIYKNEDISKIFTTNEKNFLIPILKKKNTIVSRNSIASSIWNNTEEKDYSDWALDRIAFRIRKKFQSISLDPKLLKTAKKKGFILK